MESFTPYLIGAGIAVLVGLDRTAAFQIMISRPLVAGPLIGLVLGDLLTGLSVGLLLELLWLCRMPVGASVPHDDTQVTVGATTLAIALSGTVGSGAGLPLLATLVALSLAKIGQFVERAVRLRNSQLLMAVQRSLDQGELPHVSRCHLFGLVNFFIGSLLTYTVIVFVGRALLLAGSPLFLPVLTTQADWIKLAFILVGAASLLQSLNVRRAYTLFFGAFGMVFVLLRLLP